MAVFCETVSSGTMIHKFVRQHWKFISKLTFATSCKFFFDNESSWVMFISSNFGCEDCAIFLVCIIWFSCSIGINSCKPCIWYLYCLYYVILLHVVYPCAIKDMGSVNKFCSVVFDQIALTYCILSVYCQ